MTPCPSCGADRGHLLGCEHNTISLQPAPVTNDAPDLDLDLDLDTTRARAWAVPIALAGATLLAFTGPGSFLLRVLFGMWLHEAGHTIASWFCGVFAVPLPWLTLSGSERSPLFVVMLLGGLAALGYRWRRLIPLAAVLAGLLLVGVLVPLRHATTFIVFAGDGGAMVLGTVLMLAAVLLPDDARLSHGALRWGYLVIGAGGLVDALSTWVKSWRDWAELPFGRNEGSGLSDASRLVDISGWSEAGLVRSYLALGVTCLAVLIGVATWRLTRGTSRRRAG